MKYLITQQAGRTVAGNKNLGVGTAIEMTQGMADAYLATGWIVPDMTDPETAAIYEQASSETLEGGAGDDTLSGDEGGQPEGGAGGEGEGSTPAPESADASASGDAEKGETPATGKRASGGKK